jgi:HlyD family secretion protein
LNHENHAPNFDLHRVAADRRRIIYGFRPRPVSVEITRVIRGPLRVTVDEDGRTRIKERYVVSAPLAGQLRRIELHPGDGVRAGKTPIAMIAPVEPDLLDPRMRAQLEARRRAAETQVQLAGPRWSACVLHMSSPRLSWRGPNG